MLGGRETEKAELEARLVHRIQPPVTADILPHPALLALFRKKVDRLHASLDNEAIRPEEATRLRTLIESVTIYPRGADGPVVEVVAKVGDLMSFAANENSRRPNGADGSSLAVVAGTRSRVCYNSAPRRGLSIPGKIEDAHKLAA